MKLSKQTQSPFLPRTVVAEVEGDLLQDLAPETMAEGSIDTHVWSYVKDDRAADDQLYTQEVLDWMLL